MDKVNQINDFFAKQCTPMSNDSTVPVSINFETGETLSTLQFYVDDIVKIIRSLDQKKTHGLEIPVYKKDGQQLKTNYWPVWLLPICGKVFEKIILNLLFVHLYNNNPLNSNQSGFRLADSCEHQFISITPDINKHDANLSLEDLTVFL